MVLFFIGLGHLEHLKAFRKFIKCCGFEAYSSFGEP
jgi:hypothetical protein